ncbi:Ku protein [Streptomyces sp. NPDC001933]|uniref:Ku protein n=1 Tax=Streptomyces sp. NPDC001933 TaxID=3364626 RepID=UPI00367BA474
MATFVMRGREYLVALKAEDCLLTLHSLHWADEIRNPHQEVPDLPGRTEPTAAEVKMAHQLIDALTADWDPELTRLITGTLDPHLQCHPDDEWAQLASAQLTGVRATLAQLSK